MQRYFEAQYESRGIPLVRSSGGAIDYLEVRRQGNIPSGCGVVCGSSEDGLREAHPPEAEMAEVLAPSGQYH